MAKSKQIRPAKTKKATQSPTEPKTKQTANLAAGQLPPVHLWTDNPQVASFIYACHAETIMAGLDFPIDSEAIQYMTETCAMGHRPYQVIHWLTTRQKDLAAAKAYARDRHAEFIQLQDYQACINLIRERYDLPNGLDWERFLGSSHYYFRICRRENPTVEEIAKKLAALHRMTPKP